MSVSAIDKINNSDLNEKEREDLKVFIRRNPDIGKAIAEDNKVTTSLMRRYLDLDSTTHSLEYNTNVNDQLQIRKELSTEVYKTHEQKSLSWTQVVDSFCDTKKKNQGRLSLDRTPTTDKIFTKSNIGRGFPFKGRSGEAVDVCSALLTQEKARLEATKFKVTYDSIKREIQVPVSRGLSGCGKTTLFRECIAVAGKSNTVAGERVDEYTTTITDDPQFSIKINRRCNLRIGMDCYLSFLESGATLNNHLACSILYEWKKYELIPSSTTIDVFSKELSEVTLDMVLKMINLIDGAVLINFDESQHAQRSTVLCEILVLLGNALVNGFEVYFSISGLYDTDINSLKKSMMTIVDITIPPLEVVHLVEIVSEYFDLSGEEVESNSFVMHCLWLCGGIPRYLAYLLFSMATKFSLIQQLVMPKDSFSDFCSKMLAMSAADCSSILAMWSILCSNSVSFDSISSTTIDSLLALSITGHPISITYNYMVLSDKVSTYQIANRSSDKNNSENIIVTCENIRSLEDVLRVGLAYINKQKQVMIPPVSLHMMLPFSNNKHLPLLRYISLVSSSRDNETFYASILSYRMCVAGLNGDTTISLSSLLGYEVPNTRDIMLKVTKTSIAVAKTTITASDFHTLKSNVFTVNTPTASCTDMNCLLTMEDDKQYLLCVQEKLHTEAIARVRDGLHAPCVLKRRDVQAEYDKVFTDSKEAPNEGRFAFVMVTDDDVAEGEDMNFVEPIFVISHSKLRRGCGEFLYQMRKFTASPSLVDLPVAVKATPAVLKRSIAEVSEEERVIISKRSTKFHTFDSKCILQGELTTISDVGDRTKCSKCSK